MQTSTLNLGQITIKLSQVSITNNDEMALN